MNNEAKKRFFESTGVNNSRSFYDKENNVGGVLYTSHAKKPTYYIYSKNFPNIINFFQQWNNSWDNKNHKESDSSIINTCELSCLFSGMENFKELEARFSKTSEVNLKDLLYRDFSEFAIFYYEIFPYLNFEPIKEYDINKLLNVKNELIDLDISDEKINQLIDIIPIVENNEQVLKLIKKPL